jgi:hypothetical protein
MHPLLEAYYGTAKMGVRSKKSLEKPDKIDSRIFGNARDFLKEIKIVERRCSCSASEIQQNYHRVLSQLLENLIISQREKNGSL